MKDNKLEELKTKYLLFRTTKQSENKEKHKEILGEFYRHIKEMKKEQSEQSENNLKSLNTWLATVEIYDLEKQFDEGQI